MELEAMEECCRVASIQAYVQPPLLTTQANLPRDYNTQRGLSPPTSTSTREHAAQTHPQANLMQASLQ